MKKKLWIPLVLFLCLFVAFRVWKTGSGEKIPVVIDADPGIDDAFALMAAASSDKLEILGITTVHGNVSLAKTSLNALKLACYLGIDCPVAIGAECALDGSTSDAIYVHGANGLGNAALPAPTRDFDARSAVELLHDAAVEAGGRLQILAIGPLTNIAQWMTEYPEDLELISSITVMGGSQGSGNTSLYGEFNAYADPVAAGIVYGSGVPITMVDYSITQYNYVPTDELRKAVYPEHPLYAFITSLCDFLEEDSAESGGITLHDLHAAMLLIHPDAVATQQATVTVAPDVRGDHRGETIVTPDPDGNVRILKKRNASRIQRYLVDTVGAYDSIEPLPPEASALLCALAPASGWERAVSERSVCLSTTEGEVRLEVLFSLKEAGALGAVLSVRGSDTALPPVLLLETGTGKIPLSPFLLGSQGSNQVVWGYSAALPETFDPVTDPFTLTADNVPFASIPMTAQTDLYQSEDGQLMLPLDASQRFLLALTPQANRQIAKPVLTDLDGRACTTCSAPLFADLLPDPYSGTLICAPFADQEVKIAGLETEGLSEEITSDPFFNWDPNLLPSQLLIEDFALTITESRTKTDAEGTPCIRLVYDPFTAHGRVWSASAARLTPEGALSAAAENGFLFFPLLEGESDTPEHLLDFTVTLQFLHFAPTVFTFSNS